MNDQATYAPTGRLDGRVAIVTGAGTRADAPLGIGRAIALLFAQAGANVVVADVDLANAKRTCDDINRRGGGQGHAVHADVTSSAQCGATVAAATKEFGRLDVLVNNAATTGGGSLAGLDEEVYERVIAVNQKGPTLMTGAAAPAMAQSGGGSIINIGSIDGLAAPYPGSVAYQLSKAAMVQLSKTTAHELGRQGIRANTVAPGHINANFVRDMPQKMHELRRQAGALGTEGRAEDVAWACLFLACDESRWISGVTLPVDGGLLAQAPLAAHRNLVGF